MAKFKNDDIMCFSTAVSNNDLEPIHIWAYQCIMEFNPDPE